MSPVAASAEPFSWPSSASSRARWRQSSHAYELDIDFELKLSRAQSAGARKLSIADKTERSRQLHEKTKLNPFRHATAWCWSCGTIVRSIRDVLRPGSSQETQ